MMNEEKHRLRLQELEALDNKCLQAQYKSSSIKPIFSKHSIRKLKNKFLRKATSS